MSRRSDFFAPVDSPGRLSFLLGNLSLVSNAANFANIWWHAAAHFRRKYPNVLISTYNLSKHHPAESVQRGKQKQMLQSLQSWHEYHFQMGRLQLWPPSSSSTLQPGSSACWQWPTRQPLLLQALPQRTRLQSNGRYPRYKGKDYAALHNAVLSCEAAD